MAADICRWGILGTAGIAQKNWQSIRNAPNATLTAVASRSVERSHDFIARCQASAPQPQLPDAVEGYENLLARDDVDAVYLPLPTGLRKEWAIRAVEAGKHVLVEKPCGRDAAELKEILAACQANNRQFMDGVMFMHSARLSALRAELDSGRAVGELRRIASQFSFLAPDEFLQHNIRVSSELEPQGVVGDLGWYNIRISLWAMNWQLPEYVTGRILLEAQGADSPDPVPVEFAGELFFMGGVTASFFCSFLVEHQQWAHLSGTGGNARVADFVLPFYGAEIGFDVTNSEFEIDACDFNMQERRRRVTTREYSNSHANAQETLLFRRFSELVTSGAPDPAWGDYALATQQVLDAVLESARKDSQPVALS